MRDANGARPAVVDPRTDAREMLFTACNRQLLRGIHRASAGCQPRCSRCHLPQLAKKRRVRRPLTCLSAASHTPAAAATKPPLPRKRGLLDAYVDAAAQQFAAPPPAPAALRRPALLAVLPGHLMFVAAVALLLWYYAQATVEESQVANRILDRAQGWQCTMLGAVDQADVVVMRSFGLVQGLNPQAVASSLTPQPGLRCAADLVMPTAAPGNTAVPPAYTFVPSTIYASGNLLNDQSIIPCPAVDATGKPLRCLPNAMSGVGPWPAAGNTTYEYVVPTLNGSATGITYQTLNLDADAMKSYPLMHATLQNLHFPTYEACLSDLTAACAPMGDNAPDVPFGAMPFEAAAALPWADAQPGFHGLHRWKLCTLYDGPAAASDTVAVASFFWLDAVFLRAATNSSDPRLRHFVFQRQQTCTADVIAAAINDMSAGPSFLKQAFCEPLRVLPPYSCSRSVRRPVLEILSLSASNAISGLGVYMLIAGVLVQRAVQNASAQRMSSDEEEGAGVGGADRAGIPAHPHGHKEEA